MTWAVFDDQRHGNAVREILSGSDRIVAIVRWRVLEETYRPRSPQKFRNDKDAARKLTRPNGALGNAASKIDLLYLLKAFEEQERDAMLAICEIRNLFAHNIKASFEWKDERMTKALTSLDLHIGLTHYPHHMYKSKRSKEPLENTNSSRDKFLVNLRLCLIALMRDRCSHRLWSNTPLSERELRKQMKNFIAGHRDTFLRP